MFTIEIRNGREAPCEPGKIYRIIRLGGRTIRHMFLLTVSGSCINPCQLNNNIFNIFKCSIIYFILIIYDIIFH